VIGIALHTVAEFNLIDSDRAHSCGRFDVVHSSVEPC